MEILHKIETGDYTFLASGYDWKLGHSQEELYKIAECAIKFTSLAVITDLMHGPLGRNIVFTKQVFLSAVKFNNINVLNILPNDLFDIRAYTEYSLAEDAARYGSAYALQWLLNTGYLVGADIQGKSSSLKDRMLRAAIENGHVNILRKMKTVGCKLTMNTMPNTRHIFIAASSGQLDVIKWLEKYCDLSYLDKDGYNVTWYAYQAQQLDVLKWLRDDKKLKFKFNYEDFWDGLAKKRVDIVEYIMSCLIKKIFLTPNIAIKEDEWKSLRSFIHRLFTIDKSRPLDEKARLKDSIVAVLNLTFLENPRDEILEMVYELSPQAGLVMELALHDGDADTFKSAELVLDRMQQYPICLELQSIAVAYFVAILLNQHQIVFDVLEPGSPLDMLVDSKEITSEVRSAIRAYYLLSTPELGKDKAIFPWASLVHRILSEGQEICSEHTWSPKHRQAVLAYMMYKNSHVNMVLLQSILDELPIFNRPKRHEPLAIDLVVVQQAHQDQQKAKLMQTFGIFTNIENDPNGENYICTQSKVSDLSY